MQFNGITPPPRQEHRRPYLNLAALQKQNGQFTSVSFSELEGWEGENLSGAFDCFLRSARALINDAREDRPTTHQPPPELVRVARRVLGNSPPGTSSISNHCARDFFSTHFEVFRLPPTPQDVIQLTGYFEPQSEGSLTQTNQYSEPVLSLPAGHVRLDPPPLSGPLKNKPAARRDACGNLIAYPTRKEIEAGALGDLAPALVYLSDPVEVYFSHIQGSLRVQISNANDIRLTYAGRNGHPYRSIGAEAIKEGLLSADDVSMTSLKNWLHRNPVLAPRLLHHNPSYIFFKIEPRSAPSEGPTAAASVPLTAWRSIAIDRSVWSYHLPFWLVPNEPAPVPPHRLVIGQDTGSAIKGLARADLFSGSGQHAGEAVSALAMTSMKFYCFWPKLSD